MARGLGPTLQHYSSSTSGAFLVKEVEHVQSDQVERRLLKQRFNVWSVIGINFSLTATPLGIGSYLVFTVGVGGPPFFIYAYAFAVVMQLMVCLSLAEMAASLPHVSGQIFWAAAFAPPKSARLLSYWAGALTVMSWTFATGGCFVLAAKMVAAFAVLVATGYQIQPYHIFLLALAAAILSLAFNIWLFQWVPKVACFLIVFINVGTVFILVALLVRTQHKAAASSVFTNIVNETGWSSNALVFCLNILPGSLSVCAFDTAAHMAEEMPRPQRHIPQVMVYTAMLSAVGGLIMAIVYQFCTTDPVALLNPIGGQPIFQLLLDSLRSRPLVILAAIVYCTVVVVGCIFFVTTLSRIIWSFSSHGGTCFGTTLGAVDPTFGLPVNAVYATTAVTSLVCVLELGPNFVMNALFGASGVCAAWSFSIPIWCLLFAQGGRQRLASNRPFSMKRMGFIVNIVAAAWEIFQSLFLAFPVYYPVTAANMNWVVVVLIAGVAVFGLNWYCFARHYYQTPKAMFVEADETANAS
ncbi:Amino acid/polyamine transporter I [Cordyceps fumosorosea ARSEF 2679]|uniref:Amino acid/polyamine transporter I n=1 Tax=Cordyceps fumosorosea (strain ARSEF 2679) TaxID=1081104 RepID=A0A167DLD6_CORFA|nr:Amino acid/polyamine transporter I [Cordyceps fumosorosea ARSEF 2679]OAA42550.1 Amino acid/polyamine transporter I [Cordyceps fumosorosea ARSEF 2679]